MPREARFLGSNWTRTAYFWAPKTCTCATPFTMEIRWARSVSRVLIHAWTGEGWRELSTRKRIGWSAGLTFR